MTIQRVKFKVSADTGSVTDTGPGVEGAILQTRWIPSTADTGGDLNIRLAVASDTGFISDTGRDIVIANETDCLGTSFTRVYKQPMHGADGSPDPADTGAAFGEYIYAAGERVRIRVTPGGASVAGDLYIWVGTAGR